MRDYKIKSEGEITNVDIPKRMVSGYASKFGNIDLHNDMMMPGAFTKTIKERGPQAKNEIWFLHNHDSSLPLGKPSVLKEDNYGLYFEASIVDTQIGTDNLKLYEAGLINQHSIGFSTIKESKVEGKSAKDSYYQIQEVKLYEFSSVLWGANPDTPFMGMKSLDAKGLQERFDKLYKQLKSGNLMDETYELLEIEYNFIKSELFKLINDREKSDEPTPIIIDPVEEERKKQIEFLLILKENLNK
jgi:HK97 family phage prohead protease